MDTPENKQRKNSKFYYLYSNTDSTRERVCQKFFCSTLCISNTVILNAFNNRDDQGGFKGKGMRGCRSPSNKTKQEDIKFVKCHIERFPTIESHYTRSASKRQYLDSSLSIKKMYIQYQEYCHINQIKPVSQITYRRIFGSQYNLSFFHPKKDQCVACVKYKQSSGDQRTALETEFMEHINRKEAAEKSKNYYKELANNNVKCIQATFDLQKVFQIPSSQVSLMYNMRKLNMFNFTVYEGALPNRGWHCGSFFKPSPI